MGDSKEAAQREEYIRRTFRNSFALLYDFATQISVNIGELLDSICDQANEELNENIIDEPLVAASISATMLQYVEAGKILLSAREAALRVLGIEPDDVVDVSSEDYIEDMRETKLQRRLLASKLFLEEDEYEQATAIMRMCVGDVYELDDMAMKRDEAVRKGGQDGRDSREGEGDTGVTGTTGTDTADAAGNSEIHVTT